MASFNVSLEDSSPLITYSPIEAWTDSPENDSLVQDYSASSFHTTSAQGATATITFNGTGIWLFGAQRPGYGTYTLTVDGQTTSTGDANAQTPTFQQVLAGASNLSLGSHTAVLTNTGSGSGLDIDSVVFESQIGSSGQNLSNQTIDDAQPQIAFSSSDWQTSTGDAYFDSTLHFTQNGGATATMSFSGEAVAVYGTVSPDHSDFSVSIDGNTTTSGGGSGGLARVLHAQTLLYFANGLGPGQHNLVITADPERTGQQNTGTFMDVDAVRVFSASGAAFGYNPQSGGNPSANPSSANNAAASKSSLGGKMIGIIAGAAAGGILLIAVLVILFFFLRRHNRRKRSRMPLQSPRPESPDLPMQRPDMVEAGYGSMGSVGRYFPQPGARPEHSRYGSIPQDSTHSRRESSGSIRSVQSYHSSSRLILDRPPKGRMPRKPPPIVARVSQYDEIPPMRPNRPPDLQLSPVPL